MPTTKTNRRTVPAFRGRAAVREEIHARHRELAARAKAGDREALTELLVELRPLAFAIARQVAVQFDLDNEELFAVAWAHFAVVGVKYYDPARGTTVLTFATNTMRTEVWRHVNRCRKSTKWMVRDDSADLAELRDRLRGESEQQELAELVAEVVAEMPEMQRRVVERLYGLDGREPQLCGAVAAELGITIATVRRLTRRASRQLAGSLAGLEHAVA